MSTPSAQEIAEKAAKDCALIEFKFENPRYQFERIILSAITAAVKQVIISEALCVLCHHPESEHKDFPGFQRHLFVSAAVAQAKEEDTARLDWLERHAQWHDAACNFKVVFPTKTVNFIKVREAIDAALALELEEPAKS